MEILCIRSYLYHGHVFHLYTYDEVQHIPAGTIVKDANEIIPKSELYVDEFGGYVNISNRFRYTLLYQKGGWWVDMDTVCLQPFAFSDEYVFSSEAVTPYGRILVNTTFIKSRPGAKFLKDCIDFTIQRQHEHIHWGELGVNLISRMLFRNRLGAFVKPPGYFCPVSGYELHYLIGECNQVDLSASYAIHWWNELWKRNGIEKNAQHKEGSVYEILKRKYLL